MKAVILDGQAVNPGDLSWEELKKFVDDLIIYDNTSKDELYDRIKDCDAIFTNKVIIPSEMLPKLPKLKYIGVMATGFNTIDLEATKKAGIVVCNIPAYSTDSVAELTFALIFDHLFHVREHSNEVHNGKWTKHNHFCYTSFTIHELRNKTLGIIGYGNIGKAVAKIADALGMNVIYYNRSKKPDNIAKWVDVDTLVRESDIISLHAPLNDESRHIINAEEIAKMKKEAIVVNTARGPLIDDHAMASALKEGKISGYLTDVMSKEPPAADNPLLNCPNCTITPHIAWQSVEARERLIQILVNNYASFLLGDIQNRVN